MGFFSSANFLNIGGTPDQKTQLLSQAGDYSFDQLQGQVMSALSNYDAASGELVSSGMDSNMPSTFDDLDDLGGLTTTAMYNSLSPQGMSTAELEQYETKLTQGMFDTDLTSPQSMADRARYSELFSGL